MRLLALLLCLAALQGCVATAAVGLAGDVAEGAAKTTVFTVKTAGKAAGKTASVVLPGGGDDADGEDEEKRAER